ncbi:sulfurtransferase TusA family protein [Caenispirillum bisanense]|uniref:tRNA 2-thiouridine synthesizing protein A n=1 Tax=Caenispirillum bisanense TaxID=414052 RepID=A0A286G3M3_9PROT|nr:sulfurtransferase TusA family protein [Caenispirillum bisanense]SOD90082.1 tRNA 2-thiouridine synthesizing protein A [Caenispirillum bisanense]
MSTVTVLDVRGLQCPLPILRAKKALNGMASGAMLEVQATDPGAVADFQSFCRQTGHILREQTETDGVYVFRIEHA